MKDEKGRTIGTMHDFQGWCDLPEDHSGPHAVVEFKFHPPLFKGQCGIPVALIGDIENWKPTGFLNPPT